jgi:serine/threonine-protein kinase
VETRLAQGFFYYYGRGDAEEALRNFSAAATMKPSDANVIAAIGLVHRGQGRWQEAIAAFRRARTVDPRSYNLAFTLAETHFRMREYTEAERVLHQAAALAPDVSATYRDLLRVRLAATGDTAQAREVIEEVPRTVLPGVRGILEAQLAYYARDYESALPTLQTQGGRGRMTADELPGRSLPTPAQGLRVMPYERLAILYHLMGDVERSHAYADSLRAAHEAVLEAAEANPGPVQTGVIARAHAKRGIAYALLGEGIRAYFEGSSAVSQLPLAVDAYEGAEHLLDLAVVYTLIGESDQAIQQLETALAIPSPVTVGELQLDPLFDPLRDDPRFQALLSDNR